MKNSKSLQETYNMIKPLLADYNIALVGGCVRDELAGLDPVDYDVALILGKAHTYVDLTKLLDDLLSKGFIDRSAAQDLEVSYFECSRLYGVLTIMLQGHKFDVLLAASPNINEYIKTHDCNMNQVYYTPETGIVGELPKALIWNTRRDISSARMFKMEKRFYEIKRSCGI